MKDVKKTVLWVLVGFCMISVVVGLFNLFEFLQMATIKIGSISLGKNEAKFFKGNAVATVILAVLAVALVAASFTLFLKHKKCEKSKAVLVLLIVALVICLFFIVYSFCVPTILKNGNSKYNSYNVYGDLYYASFVHYQTYLAAALSTFIPLFIAAGLILGNVICRAKFQKPEIAEHADTDNQ